MNRLMDAFMTRIAQGAPVPGGGEGGFHYGPNGQRFRDVGKFGGEEGAWTEWSLKFRATVKECDLNLFRALEMAGESETEVLMEEVEKSGVLERPGEKSAMLYNRLVHLLNGPALTLHQSVTSENGLEVWRLLRKRYDPKTTLRNLQLWLKIMNPGKVKRSQDFLTQVNRWEGWVNMLKRDYKQEVAETARVGLLILMAPDELQGTVLEHADRLRDYAQVKEKMVMLLDARGRLKDPNAMDVGYAGEDGDCWIDDAGEEQDVGAIARGDHCYRCGGMGHIANDCSTPKGKGKGREDRAMAAKGGGAKGKGTWEKGQSKGKGIGGKGQDKGKGKGNVVCSYCGKRGHDSSRCWTLHPEQLPWKTTNAVAFEGDCWDYSGGVEMSICGVERENRERGGWTTVVGKGDHGKKEVCRCPMAAQPGLAIGNRFEALVEKEKADDTSLLDYVNVDMAGKARDLGGLEVVVPEKSIGRVGSTERLRSAGKGKVTIDSGAAESVMPRDMLEGERLVEGEAKKAGVRYVAANGMKMDNYGEKRVRFKKEGLNGVNSMLFQVTDVGKPLASVAKILDKGNTVIFSRGQGGSYVVNDKTGRRIPLVEEKGTFVMEVEYLEPDVEEEGFTGQGR